MLIHSQDFDTGKALVEELGHSKTPWRSMEGLAAIKADPSAKVKAAIAHVRAKFGPDSITTQADGESVRVLGRMIPGKPTTFVGKHRQLVLEGGQVCLFAQSTSLQDQ